MSTRQLTPSEEALLDSGQPSAVVARQLGVGESTVRRWRQKRGQYRVGAPGVSAVRNAELDEDTTPAPSELDILRDENARLRAVERKFSKLSVFEHRLLTAVEAAVERSEPCAPRPFKGPTPLTERTTKHELFLLGSDWHAGEVVDPAQVGYLNAFNWDILVQRVNALRDGVLSFASLTPNLQRLTIGWLGDMVNGIIHEELVASNEFPVAEQTIMVGELMGQFIIDLHEHIPAIHCAGVAGNHARSKPGHASKNVFDSYDWLAYHFARLRTQHLPNVTWDLPRAGSSLIEIAGQRILLFHGDGIRSTMVGFPAGGVARRANAKQAQAAMRNQRIDMLACGHFHDPQVMGIGRVLVNGSLVGINEYGDKNYGDGANPCQLMATFDLKNSRLTSTQFITPPVQ